MVDVKNAKLLLIQSQTHQNIMITDDCQIGDLVSRNKSCRFNQRTTSRFSRNFRFLLAFCTLNSFVKMFDTFARGRSYQGAIS